MHELEAALGYQFVSPALLDLALTHRSYGQENNERLEFLGDSILNCAVAEDLFDRFPEAKEGDLSRYRARIVRQESLASIAVSIGLGNCLRLGAGELKAGGRDRASILADAVEALVGAVYRDGGFSCARDVVTRLVSAQIDQLSAGVVLKDPKTRLQEALQARRMGLPEYILGNVNGPPHQQEFEVTCAVERLGLSAVGQGSSRRAAEQDAASRLWEQLNK